jgi:hypothetical protein
MSGLSNANTYTNILKAIKETLTPDTEGAAADFFVYILSKPIAADELYAFSAKKDDTEGIVTQIVKGQQPNETNIPATLEDKISATLQDAYSKLTVSSGGARRKSRKGGKTKKNIKRRK